MKLKTLISMLEMKRPHGTSTESLFVAKYIDKLPGVQSDESGNRVLRLGSSRTLISCHTDTVHQSSGTQRVMVNNHTQTIALRSGKGPRPSERTCLGADNAAGVFLALSMIEAKVPALYIFHRGEEVGGIGSGDIAELRPETLDGIDRCIAFDRRGTKDIITHQMMGRCCSDEFALALADSLDMGHAPSKLGTFTDTANYTDIVGECTNVSVGYTLEHTWRETLGLDYLRALIDRVCTIDFESLPVSRIAGQRDSYIRAFLYGRGLKLVRASSTDYGNVGARRGFMATAGCTDWCEEHDIYQCNMCDSPSMSLSSHVSDDGPDYDSIFACVADPMRKSTMHCECWYGGGFCHACGYDGHSPRCVSV